MRNLGSRKSRSFSPVVKALIRRFNPSGAEGRHAIELQNMKFSKKKHKDLAQYCQKLRDKAVLAYPGIKLSERQMCDYFSRGLDTESRKMIQISRPDCLDDALSIALTVQAVNSEQSEDDRPKKPKNNSDDFHTRAIAQDKGRRKNKSKNSKNKAADPQINAVMKEESYSNMIQMMDKLTHMMESIDDKTKRHEELLTTLQNKMKSQSSSRPQRRPLAEVKCFGCGKMGHYRNFCPNKEEVTASAGQDRGPRPSFFQPQRRVNMVEPEGEDWNFEGNEEGGAAL